MDNTVLMAALGAWPKLRGGYDGFSPTPISQLQYSPHFAIQAHQMLQIA